MSAMVDHRAKPSQSWSEKMQSDGRRVGLKPTKGWLRRNFQYFRDAFIPGLLKKRKPHQFNHDLAFGDVAVGEMEVTWIGHASFLVRTPNHNILIDPVWANWVGPLKRSREPGIPLEKLPPIDVILISHAHFDHLCLKSLKKICSGREMLLIPERVSCVVKKIQCREIREMSDWNVAELDELKVTFTPCHHWGARYLHDTHRGFGGFVVESSGHTLYHAGDSAYFDGFQEIGSRYSIDTALLPIGAYNAPSGREVHMNPEEAIDAFRDLEAGKMIPMHFDTFPISIEKAHEPLERLQEAISGCCDLQKRVLLPGAGERVRVGQD